ncbi:hypothetical protein JRQ81_006011 [Phrynocephalus forsythii]|uniref:RabBD domain-containing protein n=1 Tax=Phrynocephalus forsythii TaxID=171643 RepID=A0A9Q1B6F0_9SAUR|nr:hypothetical protein JRQ81_006011 [Phrynocephalus forsythii]
MSSSSSSVGPRGARPPAVPPPMQELPDLSHLTEEERNIIMAVMDRQKEEEEKEEAMLKPSSESQQATEGPPVYWNSVLRLFGHASQKDWLPANTIP